MLTAIKTHNENTAGKAVANSIRKKPLTGSSVNQMGIQTKLTIGKPNDKYEQEADRVADRVMTMPEPAGVQRACVGCRDKEVQTKPLFQSISPLVQRQIVQTQEEEEPAFAKSTADEEEPVQTMLQKQEEEEEEPLQKTLQKQEEEEEEPLQTVLQKQEEEEEESLQTMHQKQEEGEEESLQPSLIQRQKGEVQATKPSISKSLRNSQGNGSPLPENTRSFMESRFGADFSRVRVHTNADAVRMNRQLQAQAFTKGSDIYFNTGKYNPGSESGKHLLAHELTHVIQQQKQDSLINRKGFSSTMSICHRYLRSRTFEITKGGIKVSSYARIPKLANPNCKDHIYHISLSKEDYIFDDSYGSCTFNTSKPETKSWGGLPKGKYYLSIYRMYDNPYCCLDGIIDVEEYSGNMEGTCTKLPPTILETVHMALDIIGLAPALGVVADAFNAALYTIEGDWPMAGISAAAMLPVFGQGATVGKYGIKFSKEAAERLGREGLEAGFKNAKSGKGIFGDVAQHEIDNIVEKVGKEEITADELIHLLPHRAASKGRKAMGVTGKTHQSMHLGPQAALRSVKEFNLKDALTRITEVGKHTDAEKHWKKIFQQQAKSGQKTITAKEMFDTVAESFRQSSQLTKAEAESLISRLSDEMFVELGLKFDDLVRLPYAKK